MSTGRDYPDGVHIEKPSVDGQCAQLPNKPLKLSIGRGRPPAA